MQTSITKIIQVDDLRDERGNVSIARVNRDTGEMYINRKEFAKIPPLRRKFVLYHEAGHATLNTPSEIEADNFAVEQMLSEGDSLKEILKAQTEVLPDNKKSHYERTQNLFNKLREYDLNVNGNKKVLKSLNKIGMITPQESPLNSIYDRGLMGDQYSDIFGLGKKSQARKDERLKEREQRKDTIAAAKADAIRGGTFTSAGSKIADTANTLVKTAGAVLGAKTAQPENFAASAINTPDVDAEKKKKTMIIIIVVVVIVAVVAGIMIFSKKKK